MNNGLVIPELRPNESYEADGITFLGVWENGGYSIVTVDGWKRRKIELFISRQGALLDSVEYEEHIPEPEKTNLYGAIAKFAGAQALLCFKEKLISLEDPEGNLILARSI